MIDLDLLRHTIAATPSRGHAAIVTKNWLEQAEREIVAGRAAIAQLAELDRGQDVLAVQDHLLKGNA